MNDININNVEYYSAPAKFLTAQEKAFCVYYARGYDPKRAALEAGYRSPRAYEHLLEKPEIQETMALLRARITAYMSVEVTKELLTSMLFEAHATAASSTEKVSCIKELGKINGIYEAPKVTINVQNVTRVEQLESLSDAELMRIAGLRKEQQALSAPQTIDEGEFEEMGG